MIAFEVKIYGKQKCPAGIGEQGVLSAAVSWVLREPEGRCHLPEKLNLGIGGIGKRNDEYLEWLQRKLRLGNEMGIRIVEVAAADKPGKRRQKFVNAATQCHRKEALVRKIET